MKGLLLFFKRVLYKIGIDIHFVRKEEERSAIEMNDVEVVNRAWSNRRVSQDFMSKPVLKRYQETLDILEKHAVDLSGKSVIDVGCGNGMLLKTLSEKYKIASQTGMEYAEAALQLATSVNPAANYVVHDINLPYKEQYDAVLCTEVLEHILHPANAFKNLLEMVLEDGILFITVPNGRVDTYSGHINFWSPESWDVFIAENSAGLRRSTGKAGNNLIYSIIYK
jgi:2-polyprenyl-3-methyl-5-hydroxy-6-metoxy-1,4-benzoquinol methylase